MNLLPIAITAAGAIPSIIGGIMNSILAGKKLTGGRIHKRRGGAKRYHKRRQGKGLAHMRRRGGAIKKHRRYKKKPKKGKGGRVKKHYKMKGRGVVADTLGQIPLLGMLLGPMAKAFGGKLKRMPKRNRKAAIRALIHRLRGSGMSPMYIRRPYVSSGCGLSPMYIRRPYTGGRLAPIGAAQTASYLTPKMAIHALSSKYPKMRIAKVPQGVTPVPTWVPTLFGGKGLLAPAGGYIHRKGHLRKIKGKAHKIRVKPSIVGRGLLHPAGGYIPYKGRYGVYMR